MAVAVVHACAHTHIGINVIMRRTHARADSICYGHAYVERHAYVRSILSVYILVALWLKVGGLRIP